MATIWMVVALNELNMVGLILIKVLFLSLAVGEAFGVSTACKVIDRAWLKICQ